MEKKQKLTACNSGGLECIKASRSITESCKKSRYPESIVTKN